MPAFIKFDGVDGEVDAAHSEANWEMTVKVLDSFHGSTTDLHFVIRVVDTETGNGAVTEYESGLISDDTPMSWDILKQSPWNGTAEAGGNALPTGGSGHYTQMIWADTHAAHGTGGGGAGKVSVHDVSLSASVPKAASGEIESAYGDLASAGADALGNTYLGITTIEQGVLQDGHSTMTLSFQYYMA